LVKQGLEQVEVAAIDEGDVDWCTPEAAHRLKAAETSAYDDNTMPSIAFTHA